MIIMGFLKPPKPPPIPPAPPPQVVKPHTAVTEMAEKKAKDPNKVNYKTTILTSPKGLLAGSKVVED